MDDRCAGTIDDRSAWTHRPFVFSSSSPFSVILNEASDLLAGRIFVGAGLAPALRALPLPQGSPLPSPSQAHWALLGGQPQGLPLPLAMVHLALSDGQPHGLPLHATTPYPRQRGTKIKALPTVRSDLEPALLVPSLISS
jgi:hypothetical protein